MSVTTNEIRRALVDEPPVISAGERLPWMAVLVLIEIAEHLEKLVAARELALRARVREAP